MIKVPFGVVDDHLAHLATTVDEMVDNHTYVQAVVDKLIQNGYTGAGSDALDVATRELKKALDEDTANLLALKQATASVAGSGGMFQVSDIASGKRFVL
ncbi:hypothetical protein EBN03_25945 [Nocardia stercoris]|uniref:ESX-1 secretion-associated protein n=2 Tax=Nocardia stercoris TaxID=2483361 RepID=A0A3M2L141_9NOCA|nr:hypothetical protein EBN03_25945 [Nocardia stercoris]